MTEPDRDSAPEPRLAGRRWFGNPLVRALHRDGGYLAVGLTFVYALSGLAVDHIGDWDPNFVDYERRYELHAALRGDDEAIAERVLRALGIRETPSEVYRANDTELEISLEKRSLHVELATGRVLEQGQKPRVLLRAVNYLHLNRGKKAWRYVADSYALLLLCLALSGLFMIAGKKGLRGRGLVFVAIGIAIPVLYVTLS